MNTVVAHALARCNPLRWSRRVWLGLALVAGAAAWLSWFFKPLHVSKPFLPPGPREALQALARDLRGTIVYQRERPDRPEAIYKSEIGRARAWRLADEGRYPRWSPDGRHVAYFRGTNVMLMTAGGRFHRRLASTADPNPRALTYHPNGREVWYTDGADIRAVDIRSRAVRTVVSGMPFRGLDVSADGTRLIVTISGHRILGIDLPSTRVRKLGSGCSAALSPDAERCTNNQPMHGRMLVRRWSDWSVVGEYHAPAGMTFDNEAWSNDPRWLVTRTEQPNNQNCFVHDPVADRAVQVTFTGDANRPDLFVQAGPATWRTRLADWIMERLRL